MDEETLEAEAGPAILLVEPQLGENIGAAARAMWNCGLRDLRLVRPRDGWPSDKARAAATGAVGVVEEARVFDSLREAVADLRGLYATTARRRDMLKPAVDLDEAMKEATARHRAGGRCGFLFGPERMGLSNDDVAIATKVVHIPLNPEFSSLNLGQAVLLVCYEWLQTGQPRLDSESMADSSQARPLATMGELLNFFEHLEQELDRSGFLRLEERRATTVRNLRNLFSRAHLDDQEVKTLHGVVSALVGLRKDGSLVRGGRKKLDNGSQDPK